MPRRPELQVTGTALVLCSLLLQDSVAFRVELPTTARAGQPVTVVLRLTNKTERPLTLALQGRPIAFDVVVARGDGTVLWRRLEGQAVPAMLAVRTLAAAESLVLETVWDGRTVGAGIVPPGRYVVTGTLLTDQPEGLVTPPVLLHLLPSP